MNADRVTGDALQALMQHKDYKTTQRYINMARQLEPPRRICSCRSCPGRARQRERERLLREN